MLVELVNLKKVMLKNPISKGVIMAICVYCEKEYIDERKEAGFDYCLADACYKQGIDKSEREFRKVYTPALLHKSNYFWVKKTELVTLNTRSDLLVERENL